MDPDSRAHPSRLGLSGPPRHRCVHLRAPALGRGEPPDGGPRRRLGHADLATAPDQPRPPDTPHRGDRLRRMDAGEPARAHPASDLHRVRRRPGDPLRPEHLRPSVLRLGGVLRAVPRGAGPLGRSARVPRTPWERRGSGWHHAPERPHRRVPGSVRGAPVRARPRSGREPGGGGSPRGGGVGGDGAGDGGRAPRPGAVGGRDRPDGGRLGAAALDRPGAHARARLRRPVEPLASLPGAVLPDVGPLGPVPEQRGLRLSRSAPGFDGLPPRRPGRRTGPPPAGCQQAVRGGRRAALVASGERPGRAHAILRRSRAGCPSRWTTTSTSPATAACSTSRCRS